MKQSAKMGKIKVNFLSIELYFNIKFSLRQYKFSSKLFFSKKANRYIIEPMKSAVEEHYKGIRNVLLLILILNWAGALAKIIYGLITRCESMSADGFHSLSDGASNIIGIIGIHFACQPVDKDHPYGHRKYETFFSLGIAALLFILAFNLAKEGVHHLIEPLKNAPRVDFKSFIIMLVTMAVNSRVMHYEHKKGVKLHSDILISDALHTKADIFTSISRWIME